jgi:hypothetical protein
MRKDSRSRWSSTSGVISLRHGGRRGTVSRPATASVAARFAAAVAAAASSAAALPLRARERIRASARQHTPTTRTHASALQPLLSHAHGARTHASAH